MVYSTRRFVLCLSVSRFVLVFFSPFSIAITSLGEERANLIAFRAFVRFVLVWICWFPFPLGVWEGLRFVIVALPGLYSYLFSLIWQEACNNCAYAPTVTNPDEVKDKFYDDLDSVISAAPRTEKHPPRGLQCQSGHRPPDLGRSDWI